MGLRAESGGAEPGPVPKGHPGVLQSRSSESGGEHSRPAWRRDAQEHRADAEKSRKYHSKNPTILYFLDLRNTSELINLNQSIIEPIVYQFSIQSIQTKTLNLLK